VQALFDGAVLRLPCVISDRTGHAAGPATSAMPRKRGPAVKMAPVAIGLDRPLRRAHVCQRMCQTQKLRETFLRASVPSICGQLDARHRRSIRL
jgi:hypothetical protein